VRLRYAARSDVGLLRDGNEDSAYAGPRLLAVADGMGGHAAGEVASAVVIHTVSALDERNPGPDLLDALRAAVNDANDALRELVTTDAELDGMGTTLTALLWSEGRLGLVHVGDSRAYLLRDGVPTQITHDHTLVQGLVDEGRISAEEAEVHPQRALITNALDGRADVEPDLTMREAHVGDRYLICSDGLSGVVSAETIRDTLGEGSPDEAAERLVALALRGGGPDNVTVLVADLVDEEPTSSAPVITGAAAAEMHSGAIEDSPAARARAARPTPEGVEDEPPIRHRRRAPRALLGGAIVVLVLVAGVGAAYAWINGQWYVGAAHSNHAAGGDDVAIFHGVPGSIAGVALAQEHERVQLPVSALPQYEQQPVRDGIAAGTLGEARRIVHRLLEETCPSPTPSPSASPTPTPTATPRPTAGRSPAPRPTPSATPSPSPLIPTPPPPPACEGLK
jgi:protein phosphatase